MPTPCHQRQHWLYASWRNIVGPPPLVAATSRRKMAACRRHARCALVAAAQANISCADRSQVPPPQLRVKPGAQPRSELLQSSRRERRHTARAVTRQAPRKVRALLYLRKSAGITSYNRRKQALMQAIRLEYETRPRRNIRPAGAAADKARIDSMLTTYAR